MIDIALSNRNSQEIQALLETRFEELTNFACGGNIYVAARILIAHMLEEHLNVKDDEDK